MKQLPEKYRKRRDQLIDIGILAKGGISIYCSGKALQYDIDLLVAKNYQMIEFDGQWIESSVELHFALQHQLKLVAYNDSFDALEDCLIDYEIDERGVVLVFRKLNNLDIESIHQLLDVFAYQIRSAIAVGKKLMLLVQVDNPSFEIIKPVGALNFRLWNDMEWFECDRKP